MARGRNCSAASSRGGRCLRPILVSGDEQEYPGPGADLAANGRRQAAGQCEVYRPICRRTGGGRYRYLSPDHGGSHHPSADRCFECAMAAGQGCDGAPLENGSTGSAEQSDAYRLQRQELSRPARRRGGARRVSNPDRASRGRRNGIHRVSAAVLRRIVESGQLRDVPGGRFSRGSCHDPGDPDVAADHADAAGHLCRADRRPARARRCNQAGHVRFNRSGDLVLRPSRLHRIVRKPQAVNVAARIESLCKTLGRQVLLSGDFAELCRGKGEMLGLFPLKGVGSEHAVHALPDES